MFLGSIALGPVPYVSCCSWSAVEHPHRQPEDHLDHSPAPVGNTSNIFPRCCLTVYKIFFSETFIFQEIVHLGKESKTTAFQITNGISTNKRKIVFPLYTLCEEQYILSFNQTVFSIDFHLDLNVPCLTPPPPPTSNFALPLFLISFGYYSRPEKNRR